MTWLEPSPTTERPASEGPPEGPIGLAYRIAGTAIAGWGAVVLAIAGSFLTPFRLGAVLVPVAIVLAVGGNVLLVWYAHEVTGHRFLALVPGFVWVATSFLFADRTAEGDLVLSQRNWVATVYLLAGSATIAIAAFRLLTSRRP